MGITYINDDNVQEDDLNTNYIDGYSGEEPESDIENDVENHMDERVNLESQCEVGQGFIYDYQTQNTTFLSLYKILKNNGVQNNRFFLILYDQDLQGVDPHDSTLDPVMKRKVATEVQRNFWYYLREVVRIKTEGGVSKFILHIGNLTAAFLKLQNFNYYWEQPRQTGKTIGEMCFESYYFAYGCENTEFGFYNYEDKMAKKNLQRLLGILEMLPDYLKIHRLKETEKDGRKAYQEKRDAGKKIKSYENEVLGNTIITQTVGKTEQKADLVGRGATQAKINMDEIAHYRYNWVVWASAAPAQQTAAKNARQSNRPYGVAWTSTPPDMSRRHGEWLYKFVKVDSAEFKPFLNTTDEYMPNSMFDFTREELMSWLKINADRNFFYITYQYDELGYPESWYREQWRNRSTINKFKRDILLEWRRDLSDNPYSEYDLNKIEDLTENVDYESYIVKKKYHFKLYPGFHIAKFKKIIIGCDVGKGMGGNYDCSTLCGIDPDTTEVVFTFKSNEADTKMFSNLIMQFFKKYIRDAVLIIERNNVGSAVIDNLKDTFMKKFLYFTPTSKNQRLKGVRADVRRNGEKYLFGVYNRQQIREELFEILTTRINNYKKLFMSSEIHQEITDLVDTGRRIDHKNGSHDDLLFAYMFALYGLIRDNQFYRNFGVEKPTPKKDNDNDTVEDKMEDYRQESEEYNEDEYKGIYEDESTQIETMDDVLNNIEKNEFENEMNENPVDTSMYDDYFVD